MTSSNWLNESWIDNYDLMIEEQERNRIITFINSIIVDLEKFNDNAEDLKAIVKILESEEWALGY
jgi:hypothetical protein